MVLNGFFCYLHINTVTVLKSKFRLPQDHNADVLMNFQSTVQKIKKNIRIFFLIKSRFNKNFDFR